MAVTLSNVFIFPRGQMFTKTYFLLYSISQLFNLIISSHHIQLFIHVCHHFILSYVLSRNNRISLFINLSLSLFVLTILFAERKFYDANIVLDSFQNRVLKTHLNFTSLSSESRVPSFYAFASTQLPYLIFSFIQDEMKA